jgi:hypothetical protein
MVDLGVDVSIGWSSRAAVHRELCPAQPVMLQSQPALHNQRLTNRESQSVLLFFFLMKKDIPEKVSNSSQIPNSISILSARFSHTWVGKQTTRARARA